VAAETNEFRDKTKRMWCKWSWRRNYNYSDTSVGWLVKNVVFRIIEGQNLRGRPSREWMDDFKEWCRQTYTHSASWRRTDQNGGYSSLRHWTLTCAGQCTEEEGVLLTAQQQNWGRVWVACWFPNRIYSPILSSVWHLYYSHICIDWCFSMKEIISSCLTFFISWQLSASDILMVCLLCWYSNIAWFVCPSLAGSLLNVSGLCFTACFKTTPQRHIRLHRQVCNVMSYSK